ncbi:hypothetical protein BC834DRAFT_839815 [Gloeopeniophorella convolvens]|nr:hypothetical protein BC834DRAFT_839815 [Gloeopeniophorella convolvens]
MRTPRSPPRSLASWRVCVSIFLAAFFALSASAQAQSSPPSSSTPTPSPSANITVIRETSSFTTTSLSRSGAQTVSVVAVLPTIFNVTSTIAPTPTSSANASSSANSTSSPTPSPIVLSTKVDPAFGVLGAVLILTGLPSAFLGHKNRWTSFFLIGFYTLALICFALIVKFGILHAVNPPSRTLRGMFVLSSFVAGTAGGGITVFFWKATKYFIGAWGGLAFAWWIQCFRDGGLIRPIGIRWLMFIGCAVVGFVLCTIPKIHYHVLLVATAFVGATSIMLGADCFSTAGLKEFYVWNLGFRKLYPKFINNHIEFPVSQTMQIELGLIGAITLMGIAVQFRILHVLQRKLKEITEEQKRREAQNDTKAAERFSRIEIEKAEWEKEHPTLGKYDRRDSEFSGTTLLKGGDGSSTPGLDDSAAGIRPRRPSGLSEFLAASTPEEDLKRAARNSQSPGALPALDLGSDIKDDVPRAFVSEDIEKANLVVANAEELKSRDDLLQEIQTIRRSIDILKAETPQPSSGSSSRHQSFTTSRHTSLVSRARTLSYDLNSAVPGPSHLRPPRQADPRAMIQSMEGSASDAHVGHSIGRPTSAPLRDDDWDTYLRDRKLLQPPSGVSAPIPTTPLTVAVPTPRLPVPAAVHEALLRRQKREMQLETGVIEEDRNDSPASMGNPDLIAAPPRAHHRRTASSPLGGSYMPPTILPPKKVSPPPLQQPRTVTYEELTERHREKLRELQAPLTEAQREQAEVEAAKARWERARAAERQAVTKRQAERAAAQAKESRRRRSEDVTNDNANTLSPIPRDPASRHARSKSVDRLSAIPSPTGRPSSSSARISMLKVEDWQRYQTEQGQSPSSPTRRNSGVPFPDSRDYTHRSSRRLSGLPREPPN